MTDALHIHYFAAIREALGRAHDDVPLDELSGTPTVAALWRWLAERYPEASAWPGRVRVAVNHSFADEQTTLHPADEIALIPPVSGGSGTEPNAECDVETVQCEDGLMRVTTMALDPNAVDLMVQRPDAGGVVTFTGRVRDHTGDHDVSYLVYEAYPEMALKKLTEVSSAAKQTWPGTRVAIHHRYGRLEIGEAAVVVSVSHAHRNEAFLACQFIIDELKRVVPIWKKEVGATGEEWVGFGP
ncbi:MAG: molybdopterin converting factor subunit 1 [Myxococcota bacterium]